MLSLVPFLLLSFAVSVGLTPLVIQLGKRGFGLDQPGARKLHQKAVSRLGGISVFFGLLSGVLLAFVYFGEEVQGWWAVFLPTLFLFGLGIADDFKPLGAKMKLLAQIVAALVAYGLGLRIEEISHPFGGDFTFVLGEWSLIATVFWLVAIPNLINLIDGMDGLASGIGMFLFLSLGIVGYLGGQPVVAALSFAMAGAMLGFLVFNFPPAKIFLGDGGAYLVGFFLGASSLLSSNKGTVAASFFVIIIALGIPILDTLFALLRRGFRGLPLFRADAEHIHHRLLSLGLSKEKSLIALYSVAALFSAIGISVYWSRGKTLPIAGLIVLLLAFLAVRWLGYIGSWSDLREQIGRALRRRKDVQYAILYGQLLEVEIDRCEGSEEFWELFDRGLRRLGFIWLRNGNDYQLPEGYQKLSLPLPNGEGALTLAYGPRKSRSDICWKRIGECFFYAYSQAISKWPSIQNSDKKTALFDSDKIELPKIHLA